MPKKMKKTINKKTKLKNTVNVKINIDNSRKTTSRRASTKAPTQQPLVNFPSYQPMRIQQLEPKQQFNNADLSTKLDSFQKQFNTYLETKVKPETIPPEAIPQSIPQPTPQPTEPDAPSVLGRISSFFENRIDNFSVRDDEAINRKEQQIKIKQELKRQKQMEDQQEFEVKRIIRLQKETREKEKEEQTKLLNIRYEKALQNQKQRESNERSMMGSEDIPENLLGEEEIKDFLKNATDQDIKLWLQNAQPDVKKATLKIIKENVKKIKTINIERQKEAKERLMMKSQENIERQKQKEEKERLMMESEEKQQRKQANIERQKQKEADERLMMYLEEDNDKLMAQLKPKKLKMVVNKLQETKPSLFQTNLIVKEPEIIKGLREYQAEPKETNKFKLNIQEKVKGLKQKEEPKRESLLNQELSFLKNQTNKELTIIQIDNEIEILEERKRNEKDGRKRRPITTKINNLIKNRDRTKESLFMEEEDINIF